MIPLEKMFMDFFKELDLVCAEQEKQWKETQKKALKILNKKGVREKIEALHKNNLKK